MMRLFGMECKKIAGSILYWVLVVALLAVSIFQYEPSVESELRRVNDPSSVFYIADSYAPERGAPDEAMEQNMMKEATKLLMYNYRDNSYLYYPFGYVKEKTMSAQEQAAILQYLMELTGLSEQAINGTADETADETDSTSDTGDIPISGGGAFVFKPGEGSLNENGQFVIGADEGQYVPGDEAAPETPAQSRNDFEIQVTFERFKEIMEKVNKMIGSGSYFSWPMLKLYYFGNDMEEAPISERQHKEFYEGDKVTGAFARYYCDSISISVLFLPAFVIVDLMLRDKRRNMRGLIYPRTISSAKLICTRYAAAVCITMLPILILPVKSLVVLMRYCGSIGVQGDVLAFVKYTLAWILPTVMLVMAVSLLVTALLENYAAILISGVIWLIGKPPIDKLEGGNYGLFDLIIRHNTLRGYGRMMENIQMLALNRITITLAALVLVGLAILVYSRKRKGGLTFGNQKSAHHHGFKFTAEH
ncbi:hypothetical protein [Acutalibacter muris]|jgi:hypothetical protein|uniref:hypothetical protein n=1 Tax=Acutalibacter muris TaxID=1796620 RepID=UPI0026F3DC00|nr:hypothetical protein [Acutalibacter muris]